MAKEPDIKNIQSGYASNTQLNYNFESLQDAFNNTLSRDGSTPNQMNADVDLNSNDLLNIKITRTDELYINGVSVGSTEKLSTSPEASDITYAGPEATNVAGVLDNLIDRTPVSSPEMFGGVGDGVTDDTAAVNSARTKAGENGLVYYSGTYLITSVLDVPLARATGPGKLKFGSVTWPVEEARTPYRLNRVRSALTSTVADTAYSFGAIGLETIDGRIVIAYHQGRNHGQSDEEAIAFPQTKGTSGDLTINGNETSGGVATLPGSSSPGARVEINSVGDDSGITFTITGTVGGSSDSEVVTGPNATVALSTKKFQTVTQVAVSGPTADDVRVGWFVLPGDTKLATSSDDGGSWTSITTGDGLTTGEWRYYLTAVGQFSNGDGVLLVQRQSLADDTVVWLVRRTFDGFRTFGPEETITYTGDALSGTTYFYGNISTAPDGRLVSGGYASGTNGVFTSEDGVTWNYTEIVADGGTNYSEPAILALDADWWIALVRIDGATSAMRMFRSTDGGSTWTDLGATNLTVGGGYVSPQLDYVNTDGGTEAFFVNSERQVAAGGVDPNSVIARFGNVDDVDSSSTAWSETNRVLASFAVTSWATSQTINKDEYRLYSNGQTYRALQDHTSASSNEPTSGASWEDFWVRFNPRGGYSAHALDHTTGEGWITYAKETGYRSSSLLFKRINFRKLSAANFYAAHQSWTPTLIGSDTAGSTTLSTDNGTYTRIGPLVLLNFDIHVTGAFGGSGTVQIGNLPFTVSTVNRDTGKIRCVNAGTLTGLSAEGVFDSKLLNLWHEISGGSSLVTDTEISNDFRVEGSIMYMTDD